jgi:hypothetical protein
MDTPEFENIILPVYFIHDQSAKNSIEDFKTFFVSRKEFEINIQESKGGITLKSLQKCINIAIEKEEEVIIICNTKHNFNDNYNFDSLINNILKANEYGCEILLGGFDKFNHAVPINTSLFWIDSFSSSNFMILFSSVFEKILNEQEVETANIYEILSYITSHKMTMFPFISISDYSDIETLVKYQHTGEHLSVYKDVYDTYLEPVKTT